jgi:hypothetical protein
MKRAQFAALLRRSFEVPVSEENFFIDDDTTIFAADIDAIAALGITRGCDTDRYCPWNPVYRDQAATLLSRIVQWWRGAT